MRIFMEYVEGVSDIFTYSMSQKLFCIVVAMMCEMQEL